MFVTAMEILWDFSGRQNCTGLILTPYLLCYSFRVYFIFCGCMVTLKEMASKCSALVITASAKPVSVRNCGS
jgi:hypothetical protein